MKNEERKYPRVKICNTVSCIGSDEDGTIIEQIIGVVSDISQNGLLMESIQEIESANLSLMASTKENSLIEIKGKVKENELKGRLSPGYSVIFHFVINISSDGMSFEGNLRTARATHYLKGKRIE